MSLREEIIAKIASHGHMLIGVGDAYGGPPFIYTIGLTSRFGFELLVCGLPMKYADIVNSIAEKLPFHLNEPNDEFTNLPLMLKRCDNHIERLHDEFVCQANVFYGKNVDVVQIVLSDKNGNFPGHSEYDHEYMDPRQPLFYRY